MSPRRKPKKSKQPRTTGPHRTPPTTRPPLPPSEQPERPGCWHGLLNWHSRAVRWIVGIVGFAAALAGALALLPELSISSEDLQGSKNPISAPFTLANEGLIPVHDVSYDCTLDHVEGIVAIGPNEPFRRTLIHNVTIVYVGIKAPYLAKPDQVTLPCNLEYGVPRVRAKSVTVAHMTVAVQYTPWLLPNWTFFRRRKAVGFVTYPEGPDSTYRWFPDPPGRP
jgi:hypothetical protein